MNVLADVSQMKPVDAGFLAVLNSLLLLFGIYVLARSLYVLQQAKSIIESFGTERETSDPDAETRWKVIAWLIGEHGFGLHDVKRINFQSNLRDRLYTAKTLNELLPVGGFLGTILPLAWFFFTDPAGGGQSLAEAIVPPLGTALLTTVVGLGWFGINALVQAYSESLLGQAERTFDAEAQKRLHCLLGGNAEQTAGKENVDGSATAEQANV